MSAREVLEPPVEVVELAHADEREEPLSIDDGSAEGSTDDRLEELDDQLRSNDATTLPPVNCNDLHGNILACVVEATELMEMMDGSQQDFLSVMKRMFNRAQGYNVNEANSKWPKSWKDAQKIMEEAGCRGPKTYYVCLNNSHFCSWDVMENESNACKISGEK